MSFSQSVRQSMDDTDVLYDFVIQKIKTANKIKKIKNEKNITLSLTEHHVLRELLKGKTTEKIIEENTLPESEKKVLNSVKYINNLIGPICLKIGTALQLLKLIDTDCQINKTNLKLKLAELVRAENGFKLKQAYLNYIERRCGSLDIVYPSRAKQGTSLENSSSPEINEVKLQIEALYVQPRLREIQKTVKNIDTDSDVKKLKDILDYSKNLQTPLRWMIYGRSGYGKTSLLKYLAVKCKHEEFQKNLIPIYISLKRYINHIYEEGQQNILTYLITAQNDFICKALERNYLENQLRELLSEGKMLILLDGLDVAEDENSLLANSVRKFIDWYPKNSFIISSRGKRFSSFNDFDEYDLQDFNDEQKKDFIDNRLDFCEDNQKTRQERINNLCKILGLVPDKNSNQGHIKDFVCSPLLLAYLCLVESTDYNFNLLNNKKETQEERELFLCKLAIFELLKWDDNPDLEYDRDDIYRSMSVKQRADFLSKLAIEMLKSGKGEYVPLSELVNYSARYLFPVHKAENREEFRIRSEQVLLAIETQDGLLTRRIFSEDPEYSFPHQTVRDFFAAWWLSYLSIDEQLKYWENYVKNNNSEDKSTSKKWENIFRKALIINKIQQNELMKAYETMSDHSRV